MKIFEARYDEHHEDKTVTEVIERVTADNLLQVVTYYTAFCEQYEFDLTLVREVFVVVRDLRDTNAIPEETDYV